MAAHADPGFAAALDLLRDGFGRIHEGVPVVVDGLPTSDLSWRPDPDANSIGWLVWHLTRQQDAQLAELGGEEQAWSAGGWVGRFRLPYPADAHGYGMTSEQVGAFTVGDPGLLTGYHEQVQALTERLIDGLTPARLAEVIDSRWDPPVTVAVRIISVLDDAAKHLGQAEYVRGLVERRG